MARPYRSRKPAPVPVRVNWQSMLLTFCIVTPVDFVVNWALQRHRLQFKDVLNAILFGIIFTASIAALRVWDAKRTAGKGR